MGNAFFWGTAREVFFVQIKHSFEHMELLIFSLNNYNKYIIYNNIVFINTILLVVFFFQLIKMYLNNLSYKKTFLSPIHYFFNLFTKVVKTEIRRPYYFVEKKNFKKVYDKEFYMCFLCLMKNEKVC